MEKEEQLVDEARGGRILTLTPERGLSQTAAPPLATVAAFDLAWRYVFPAALSGVGGSVRMRPLAGTLAPPFEPAK